MMIDRRGFIEWLAALISEFYWFKPIAAPAAMKTLGHPSLEIGDLVSTSDGVQTIVWLFGEGGTASVPGRLTATELEHWKKAFREDAANQMAGVGQQQSNSVKESGIGGQA